MDSLVAIVRRSAPPLEGRLGGPDKVAGMERAADTESCYRRKSNDCNIQSAKLVLGALLERRSPCLPCEAKRDGDDDALGKASWEG